MVVKETTELKKHLNPIKMFIVDNYTPINSVDATDKNALRIKVFFPTRKPDSKCGNHWDICLLYTSPSPRDS